MRQRHQKVSAVSDGGDSSLVQPSDWNADHLPALVLDSKVASYPIASADGGKLLRAAHSASITFTLPAASGLSANWCIWVENKQTGAGAASELLITRNGTPGTDTIDGVATIYTYPGDLRVIFRTGAGTFESTLIRGGMVLVTNTAGETIYWPSGAAYVELEAWGGGGSGGAGGCADTNSIGSGGTGGGGGAKMHLRLAASAYAASTSFTHTPGATKTGPAGRSTQGRGTDGGAGNTTTIATGGNNVIRSFGGGGGYGGAGNGGTNLGQGGGGGSVLMVGNVGASFGQPEGGRGGGHHGPDNPNWVHGVYSGGQGLGSNGNQMGGSTYGGGGGGGNHLGGDGLYMLKGGISLFGGGGGGAGGCITSGNVATIGTAGGATGNVHSYDSTTGPGGGGAAATAGTSNAGGDGSTTPGNWIATSAGGGGGSITSAAAGRGGHGGIASGGGGGGASRTGNTSGAGGDGGQGATRMSYG